ncbi:MAG: FtsX-like permease family protein [Promethearchaeota archaeon]
MVVEKLLLNIKLLKGNRRNLFPIIFSLALIMAVVTSVCIILDSNSDALFMATRRELSEEYRYHIKLEISFSANYLAFEMASLNQIIRNIEIQLNDTDLQNFLQGSWIEPGISSRNQNTTTWGDSHLLGNTYFFEDDKASVLETLLLPESRLPQNANETILMIPEREKNEYTINSNYSFSAIYPNSSFPLKIVGILPFFQSNQFPTRESYYEYLKQLRGITGINIGYRYGLITRKNDYSSLVKKIGISSSNPKKERRGYIEFFLLFNVDKLKAQDRGLYLSRLKLFKRNIQGLSWGEDYLERKLNDFQRLWETRFFEFLFLSLPVIIISLYFTNYVVDNTNFSRLKRNQSLFIRGFSLKQIFVLLVFEVGVSILGTLLLGGLLGVILSVFLISFMSTTTLLILNINNWFLYVLFISIMINGMVYGKIAGNIVRVYLGKDLPSFRKSEEVTIHSWALKMILFGIIIIAFSFIVNLLDIPKIFLPVLDIWVGLKEFTQYLVTISLVCLTIGLLFSLRFIFSSFVIFLSNSLWKRGNSLPTFALKNINRFRKSFSDTWLFLTLLVFYSFCLLTSHASANFHMIEQARFVVGADYRIGFPETKEAALTTFLTENLPSQSVFTKITVANMDFDAEWDDFGMISSSSSIALLGIDPETFFEVGYNHWQLEFTPSMAAFQKAILTNKSKVSVSKQFLFLQDLKIDSLYHLQLLAENFSAHFEYFIHPIANVTVVSSFKIYPLIARSPGDQAMIIHKDFLQGLEAISDEPSSIVKKHYFLINTDSEISPEVLQILKEDYLAEISWTSQEIMNMKVNRSWDQFIDSQQVVLLVSLVLACGCVLLLGMFQQNRRTREHALERALGVKKQEIFLVTLIESVFVIFTALIIGTCTGILYCIIYFSSQSILWLQKSGLYPPVILPFNAFIPYFIWFLIFVIISLIPSNIIQQRYSTGLLLKQYEQED